MDALVRAFASDNDNAVVAADEGDVVNGPGAAAGDAEGDGEASDASDAQTCNASACCLYALYDGSCDPCLQFLL